MITDSITIHPFWYANIAKYTDVFFVIDDFSNVILRKLLKKTSVDVVTSFFPIEKHYFITKKKISNKNIVIVLS